MTVRRYSHSFQMILNHLAEQDPAEKLRIAFHLNEFVKKIHTEGMKYVKSKKPRAGATA